MTIDFRRLTEPDAALLALFFTDIRRSRTDSLFHPHPFTPIAAETICRHGGDGSGGAVDEYHAAFERQDARELQSHGSPPEKIVAYGMLRGWSEGYAVPSLGIAVHPDCRGRGIARRFMQHLHSVAAERGAETIRLKVYRHNEPARRLYESLGYRLEPHSDSELLGLLSRPRHIPVPC